MAINAGVTPATILVVEDDQALREMLVDYLSRRLYRCLGARNVIAAREQLSNNKVDLMLLDWNLPVTSGVQFARDLRASESYSQLPIIMLTARSEDEDQIKALSSGADDYLAKPFSWPILLLRLEKLLKRKPNGPDALLALGALRFDTQERYLLWEAADSPEPIKLAPMEAKLLEMFMHNPDKLLRRAELKQMLWGSDSSKDRALDVHTRNLRKKLSQTGCDPLLTYYGSGYKLDSSKLTPPGSAGSVGVSPAV